MTGANSSTLTFPGLNEARSPSLGNSSSPKRAVAQITARFYHPIAVVSRAQVLLSLPTCLCIHLVLRSIASDSRQMLQDCTKCALMNRWKFCQLCPNGGKVTADVQLSILGVSHPLMLGNREDGLRQLSAILLQNRGYRKDIMFLLREAESFLIYKVTVSQACKIRGSEPTQFNILNQLFHPCQPQKCSLFQTYRMNG